VSILNKINNPSDMKSLSINELEVLCDDIAELIKGTVEEHGGHYSSPLGVIELTVALHYVYETPDDKLIWDVGHQAYPHKILTNRKNQFKSIRQKDGISGFLKIKESKYDAFGAGHSSTSISAALGYAHARDKDKSKNQVVAIIGDGAMTGGMAYEGINNLGYHKTQMTVVLNDNSLSISKSVGALSKYLTLITTNKTYNKLRKIIWKISGKIPIFSNIIRFMLKKSEKVIKGSLTPGSLFEDLGLRYIGPIDGHNLKDLIRAFKSVKEMNTPVLLHVYTKKGKRISVSDHDSIKYYSLSGSKNKKKDNLPYGYSKVFGLSLKKHSKTFDELICITAAMEIGTGLDIFSKANKDKYIDVGIAEEHAVTYAAGLAAAGKKPLVVLYSTFFQRAFDQVFHDVLLQKLPVIFCLDRAGLVGADGPTHHGVFDISMMINLPGIVVSAPKDGNELDNLLLTALKSNVPFCIRYPKSNSINYHQTNISKTLNIGSWEYIKRGKRIAILATGSMVEIATQSIDIITEKFNFIPTVVNCRFLKPFDKECLNEIISNHDLIITMEEGSLMGGFGSTILDYCKRDNIKVESMGIKDSYIEHGSRQELLDLVGLNSKSLINLINDHINDRLGDN
jgi:1-deoxy-D-xylulose-5-phosphate synthase